MSPEERAALIAQGWTPPVDPDLAEAEKVWDDFNGPASDGETSTDLALAGIKRGRELERAIMGNHIPEQIQEVTPPVDPDIALAVELSKNTYWIYGFNTRVGAILAGIKRGRALAATEAKPGMVWVRHDGSNHGGDLFGEYVWVKHTNGTIKITEEEFADWPNVTHYAVITQPEGVA